MNFLMWMRSVLTGWIIPPRTELWRETLEQEQEQVRQAHATETMRLDDLAARRRIIAAEVRNLERITRTPQRQ